ncbi:MAG: hypothetical protein RDV48_29410 [Candidatus Eremiobacteraeota bacterium]|nr:hypothetical protein [Candidatus Eremiobacteraeota bacterium]MDQ7826953.1 hypothetical protein [Candidatus Eremiobacteraeota bacterium]
MADISIQPRTAYAGPYGGYGEYGGAAGVSADGTKGAIGGAGYHVGPNGGVSAGAGFAAAGPNGAIGGFAGATDNPYVSGSAKGGFAFNAATGEFDSANSAQWTNKTTGESHSRSVEKNLQLGQGGTISVTRDGVNQTYTIPPRPTE